MIIDCHGHYTTAPKQLEEWRKRQIAALEDAKHAPVKGNLGISDDEIRASLEGAQLKLQRERGTDITIFSPRAMGMSHHIGNETTSRHWSEHCNEMIHRVCMLYPEKFVGVCQLPQSPGVSPKSCIPELERCVKEFGFIGCNLNPDPSGGYWKEPPLTDKWWYPLYEKMVELEVPAMVHVSASCNPNFHGTGALHQRRHHRVHAVHHRGPVPRFLDAEIHHSARRRRGALSLGPLPGPRAGHETPAAEGVAHEQRLLRHLRLPPARDRPAPESDPGRQHPFRLRDGRCGEGRRPGDRLQLR